ncbi:hypothetical protein J7L97_02545 [Candidatus Bathyarchaeota archaeon]|nr:hypothetical protein [Candidatus Bathyarchaeota archaeon]
MKYTIHYSRKVRIAAYDMLEIGYIHEFDEKTDPDIAFECMRNTVESWIQSEKERLLEKRLEELPRPETAAEDEE